MFIYTENIRPDISRPVCFGMFNESSPLKKLLKMYLQSILRNDLQGFFSDSIMIIDGIF